jgi:hypothetical protein
VVVFNNNEKTITDTASAAIIIYGRDLSSASAEDAHSITGNNGSTQGANIVNTPAKNDNINKSIL